MKTQTINKEAYCSAAAVRYARVLYELKVPGEAVQKAAQIYSSVEQLHDIFVNPTIPLKKKLRVIDKVFPMEMHNFLKVVCRYQRMDLLEDIFSAYDSYCRKMAKELDAVLLCTEPPAEEQRKGIEAFLCRKYGAEKAHIEICEDPELLGGFILRAGSDEYDWSMKGRLDRLQQKLTWR